MSSVTRRSKAVDRVDSPPSAPIDKPQLTAADLPIQANFDRDVQLSLPLITLLLWVRARVRHYLYWQVEWTTLNLQPYFVSLRGNRMFHYFFVCASACGEEEFYMILIPVLLYNTASNIIWSRGLITVFIVILLVGDWLKAVLTLPRPPLRWLYHASEFDSDVIDNRDFGWPSTHAAASLAVPFFVIHEFGASIWQVYQSQGSPNAWTWSAALLLNAMALSWTFSISVARMYLGAHSPADVQGGLIFSVLTLRLWFWYGNSFWVDCMNSAWLPLSSLFYTVMFLLLTPRPKHPITNYTFLEEINLVGFLQGHFLGCWLRWDAQPNSFCVAQLWSSQWRVALLRNVVGFVFFISTHIVTKKLFYFIANKLSSASNELELSHLSPQQRRRKLVVTKDISCDPYRCAARFLTYSYLGVMAAYLAPNIFDAMGLWA